jgi:hypothetical protein
MVNARARIYAGRILFDHQLGPEFDLDEVGGPIGSARSGALRLKQSPAQAVNFGLVLKQAFVDWSPASHGRSCARCGEGGSVDARKKS